MRKPRSKNIKRKIARSFHTLLIEVMLVAILAVIVISFCVQISFIHGHDMKPTWQDGDWALINKIQYRIYEPERQDVVLLKIESSGNTRSIVRRVVGLPGETIQIRDGVFYVKGEALSLVVPGTIHTPGIAQEAMKLGEDEYFVLCDNYNRGEDSRMETIGIVNEEQIVGKVTDIKTVLNNLLRKYNLN